jgi:nucleoside-diphosphate-sugar epimerase
MSTLVTGAAGFVGGHLVEQLLAHGQAVQALVHNPADREALRARGVEAYVGDIREPETANAIVPGARVIFHCAAAVGPHVAPGDIWSTNREGVRALLETVRRAGSRARVVLLSSVNVLGTRNLDPATEDLPCRRSSDPAADVKIDAERLALNYHRQGVDVTILRPGFIYGPGDPHNIPRLASALERGKFAFIGSRDNVVPIVHVEDVACAMLLASAIPVASGRIYHITDGSRTTIGQFVDALAEQLGCQPPRRVMSYTVPYLACHAFEWLRWLHLYRGQPPITRAALRFLGTSRFVDIRRAREELGYAPQIDFRTGLAETVRQFKEHCHGPVVAASPG